MVRRGMGQGNLALEMVDIFGKKVTFKDPTQIYVDQAWVGRGEFQKRVEARARGRTNILMCPRTQITVRLKEDKTRIRLMREKQVRKEKEKVWAQLPDIPIRGQRSYYTW
jgi:hypothetical protein